MDKEIEHHNANLSKVIEHLYVMGTPYILGLVKRKFDYKKIKQALHTAISIIDIIEATQEAISLRDAVAKENEK